ncbi:MAG: hypothetical protein ACI4OU_06565, partial [Candidatus Enterenecus sp.]
MKDMTVSKALKWLFIAQILLILAIVPLVGWILAIVGFVLNLLALYGASKLEQGYYTAFILSVAGIVVSLINGFVKEGFLATLLNIAASLISLGITYYVIHTTVGLLNAGGIDDVAAKGETVWKTYLICAVAGIVVSLLAYLLPVVTVVLTVVVGIVEIVAFVLYLIFLYKSS